MNERRIAKLVTKLRVGVRSSPPAETLDNINEATVVLDTPLATASLLLLLFLLLNFRGLSLHLTGTSKGTVDLTSEQWDGHINAGRY